jgi:UDP-N-acetylmuramate--alanine ligase
MSRRSTRRQPEHLVDLSRPLHCHVVGVGGPGMSPLAYVLHGKGHRITGSDLRESDATRALSSVGVDITIGHRAELVHHADVVTYSTAIPITNVEMVEASERSIPVRHRSGLLASLCAVSEAIGVAGTHGKTTTSALLTHILIQNNLDPSCIIGAEVPGLVVGARVGQSPLFVLESDESDGTLDVLPLSHLIVTNVDVDHLDYFGTFEDVQQCFVDAVLRTTGHAVVNCDDAGSAPVVSAGLARGNITTVGHSSDAMLRIVSVEAVADGLEIDFSDGTQLSHASLPLFGEHNAMNCAAAIAMAQHCGVTLEDACRAVDSFRGVRRRFTERGSFNGGLLVDDYAHLPAEIEAALQAARSHPHASGRLIAVFQPNRFHRIAAMADTYADCFTQADVVVVTDVYASGTERIEGVTGELVVNAIRSRHPETHLVWAPQRSDIVSAVASYIREGDVCISMGCGDIETFPDDLMRSQS